MMEKNIGQNFRPDRLFLWSCRESNPILYQAFWALNCRFIPVSIPFSTPRHLLLCFRALTASTLPIDCPGS